MTEIKILEDKIESLFLSGNSEEYNLFEERKNLLNREYQEPMDEKVIELLKERIKEAKERVEYVYGRSRSLLDHVGDWEIDVMIKPVISGNPFGEYLCSYYRDKYSEETISKISENPESSTDIIPEIMLYDLENCNSFSRMDINSITDFELITNIVF